MLLLTLLSGCILLLIPVVLRQNVRRPVPFSSGAAKVLVAVAIPVSLVFAAGLNLLASAVPLRWDVTYHGQHTLLKSTEDFLKHLPEPTRFTVFYVGIPPKYLEDMLKEYGRASAGMITHEIIDPLEDLGYAAQFGNAVSGAERKVIVQAGEQRRDVDFSKENLTEEMLNNALIQVTQTSRTVCFLSGHNEYRIDDESETGLSIFAGLLDVNGFIAQEIRVGGTQEVPESCDLLIVAGARDELTKQEESAVNRYLEKGGDGLFLVENVIVSTPERPLTKEEEQKNPSLNGILNHWGLEVASDVVVDTASHAGEDVGSPATRNYMPHRAIVKGLDYTFFVRPRSVSMRDERRSTIKLAPLVATQSEKESWGEKNRYLKIKFDPGEDREGPVPIAYLAWEPKNENEVSDTRLAVVTDTDFISNAYISHYSNAELGFNLVQWLTEQDHRTFFGIKDFKVERLDLTNGQKKTIAVILVLMPIGIAAAGIFVWLSSRR